jgi:uncharacterized damage-inducible protein DinB
MGHVLHDQARYNTWATTFLIDFCAGLDETILTTRIPGTYGSIIETFHHIVGTEMWFLQQLTGAWSGQPWSWTWDEPVGLDVLRERAVILGAVFEEYLKGEVDPDALAEERTDAGISTVAHGILLTLIIYHGSEHRAQIGTILGSLGYEVPEFHPWVYANQAGRHTMRAIGSGE